MEEPEVRRKGARACKQKPAPDGFVPQGEHRGGPHKATEGTHGWSEMRSIKVRVPPTLLSDIEDIVEYLGRWSNRSEFIRDAIRDERDRCIEEARLRKKELAGSEARGFRGGD
jgi:Arc/MetJ-type ribon-helix-helix transcriptional regulator